MKHVMVGQKNTQATMRCTIDDSDDDDDDDDVGDAADDGDDDNDA